MPVKQDQQLVYNIFQAKELIIPFYHFQFYKIYDDYKIAEDKYKKKPNLLYGGSVDSSNINDIINIINLMFMIYNYLSH